MVTPYYQLCPKCIGEGFVMNYNAGGTNQLTRICPTCNGAKMFLVDGEPIGRPSPKAFADFAEWLVRNDYRVHTYIEGESKHNSWSSPLFDGACTTEEVVNVFLIQNKML